MTSLTIQITIVIISVIIGGLFTYFVTSITQRKVFRSIAEELTNYHEKIHHKKSVEDQLKEHQYTCTAVKDVGKLKTGVIWLVSQAGGNPNDIGLN